MSPKFHYCRIVLLSVIILNTTFHASRVDFYEHSEFKGKVLRIDANSNCHTLPRNWIKKISSVEAWGCVKVYMDYDCKGFSKSFQDGDFRSLATIWTQARKVHGYWKNVNWNDKIISYESCENVSGPNQLKDVATKYLEEIYKRTISVRELRRIGHV